MGVFVKVKQRAYHDSLKLMRVSAEVQAACGVTQAFAFMGTEINKTTRIPADVLTDEAKAAGADDLILMVACDSAETAENALLEFDKKMTETRAASASGDFAWEDTLNTLDDAMDKAPESSMAIISVPGQYATAQAVRALQHGLSVHLFSDNVSVDDEIKLKKFAVERDLLLMGPDCGTAMIQGVPLCFANEVRRGHIGIVAASGTGAQEVSCIIHALGGGVSHIIGVGGRDLSEAVGGIMTLQAIKMLANDPETQVIAIVSKPPAKAAADKMQEAIKSAGKPAVLIFMGYENASPIYAQTLEEGAVKAVALLNGEPLSNDSAKIAFPRSPVAIPLFDAEQNKIIGLYTGGTLASEAEYILNKNGMANYEITDLGDDEYTRGALHPMIDPTHRNQMAADAAKKSSTAIILCDVVIGHGAHHNPAGELAQAVAGVNAHIFAGVTGTNADPQNKAAQEDILTAAGITVFPSNQSAVEAACAILQCENAHQPISAADRQHGLKGEN